MDALLTQLASHGIGAIIAAIAIWIAWKKDQELKALYERFLDKAEKDLDRKEKLAREMSRTVRALTEYEEVEDSEEP